MPVARRFRLWLSCAVLLLTSLTLVPGAAQETITPNTPGDGYTRAARLGITHINSAEVQANEDRYQKALSLGVGWTRYPIYWHLVEDKPGILNWSDYDPVVAADLAHGLNTNAILLGVPSIHADPKYQIAGLYDPVFADGSDIPGANKTINPDNPWANYVYQAVQRYKPGGELGRAQGWDDTQGVRVWEVWNEPDLRLFWTGTVPSYARLLKVAYIAAHYADPDAVVMMGGLVSRRGDYWLARVLAIYDQDPQARRNNYFMDAVALHSYSYPWRSGLVVQIAREILQAYHLRRPIWVNEVGVAVWDDYPGPVWAQTQADRIRMATSEQQAWYLIQSAAYAWAEGADKVFYHQLFDDCGDQPYGTNFSPHNGELCTPGDICFGSAFGLYRNESGAACYSHHPDPGTARPAGKAYRLLADVFGDSDFGEGTIKNVKGATVIAFVRPSTSERIYVVWNRNFEPNTWTLEATGLTARLYTLDGMEAVTPDDAGNYQVDLQAAQPDNDPNLIQGDISGIGGAPVILVERFEEGTLPPLREDEMPMIAASVAPPAAPTNTLAPGAGLSLSVTPVDALPEISPAEPTAAPNE